MRVAVLVSGSGSNLQALLDDLRDDPGAGVDIVVVISDRAGIEALKRADAAGVPTEVVAWTGREERASFTRRLCDTADRHGAEVLVLAGFMRILSPEAIERFPNRILNIHPALLPAFPGHDPVDQAMRYGVKTTGVTVHFVDEHVDHGPIIAQEAVPVLPGDDEDSLHARIQEVEHVIYPKVVRALAAGRLQVDGRQVTWRERAG